MIRTGQSLDRAVAQATATALDGSAIAITDAAGNILASIPTSRWLTDETGATLEPTATVTVERSGIATGFVISDTNGNLLTGDIPTDMTLDRCDLLKGGAFSISEFRINCAAE